MSRSAEVRQRLVGHARAEVGAADADVDDVADALAGVTGPRARSHPVGEVGHLVAAPRAPRARRSRRRPRSTAPSGARSATCSTARSSVTLIFSPRNIASMRSRSPARRASATSRREGLVGDPVLRVVEVEALAPRASCARPRSGSSAKRSRRWHVAHLLEVRVERVPFGGLGDRRHPRHDTRNRHSRTAQPRPTPPNPAQRRATVSTPRSPRVN